MGIFLTHFPLIFPSLLTLSTHYFVLLLSSFSCSRIHSSSSILFSWFPALISFLLSVFFSLRSPLLFHLTILLLFFHVCPLSFLFNFSCLRSLSLYVVFFFINCVLFCFFLPSLPVAFFYMSFLSCNSFFFHSVSLSCFLCFRLYNSTFALSLSSVNKFVFFSVNNFHVLVLLHLYFTLSHSISLSHFPMFSTLRYLFCCILLFLIMSFLSGYLISPTLFFFPLPFMLLLFSLLPFLFCYAFLAFSLSFFLFVFAIFITLAFSLSLSITLVFFLSITFTFKSCSIYLPL